ncbi:MAG: hypothetical protein D6748_10825 [Calditrichaeota bacterium]|nr:MAG: hypothetical protein D6748_10825 [Calditrichota bacterium]
MKRWVYILITFTLIFIVIFGCREILIRGTTNENWEVGTVIYIQLEGGFYGIETTDGQKYLPLNLPKEFRSNGLKVKFIGKPCEDVDMIYMWGIPVEIEKIQKQ